MILRVFRILGIIIIISIIFYLAIEIPKFIVRGRQVRTFVSLKIISSKIDKYLSDHKGYIPNKEAYKIISSVMNGRDAWGSHILYRSIKGASKFSYIIISLGSDKKLDVNNINDYFKLRKVDISGNGSHDIVFRNGEAITNAGK